MKSSSLYFIYTRVRCNRNKWLGCLDMEQDKELAVVKCPVNKFALSCSRFKTLDWPGEDGNSHCQGKLGTI